MGDNEDDNPFLNRNPQIILAPEPQKNVCPLCHKGNFTGRNVQGVITFTCLELTCRNKWQGGLPRVPEDPRVPKPPMNPRDKPRVTFEWDAIKKEPIEVLNPLDLTQDFRKGALIPEYGEDDE